PKKIEKKIKSAVTDSEGIVAYDKENKPGVSNLLTIYSSCTGESIESLEEKYAGKGYEEFKQDVADAVIDLLQQIQDKYNELIESPELDHILDKGKENTLLTTNKMNKKAKKAVGLGRVHKQ